VTYFAARDVTNPTGPPNQSADRFGVRDAHRPYRVARNGRSRAALWRPATHGVRHLDTTSRHKWRRAAAGQCRRERRYRARVKTADRCPFITGSSWVAVLTASLEVRVLGLTKSRAAGNVDRWYRAKTTEKFVSRVSSSRRRNEVRSCKKMQLGHRTFGDDPCGLPW